MQKTKKPLKNLLIRCLFIIVGVSIAALSAPFLIYADLGGDPFAAFNQGLSRKTGISFGTSVIFFNLFFLLAVLFLNRAKIHLGTVFYLLLLGPLSDVFLYLFQSLGSTDLALSVRVIFVLLGIVCVGFGLGLYQAANLGAGPSDSFNQIMSEKLGIPLRFERIGYDLTLVVAAFFLGGTINIGTLLGILFIGPIMAPTLTHGAPLIDKITGTE